MKSQRKKLYKFNWQGEGFNQVWAVNKREARKLMNKMGKSDGSRVELVPVQESLKLVKDVEAYWRWMPLMD